MSSDLDIDQMSIAEKLMLMERLWEELSRQPENLPSPQWHGDILAERAAAVREGRTSFIPWEEAKRRLQERYE